MSERDIWDWSPEKKEKIIEATREINSKFPNQTCQPMEDPVEEGVLQQTHQYRLSLEYDLVFSTLNIIELNYW